MYHVSAQGIDERMINVRYYYYTLCRTLYDIHAKMYTVSYALCDEHAVVHSVMYTLCYALCDVHAMSCTPCCTF